MYAEKYWDIVSRYLSNECSQSEIEEIENKVKSDEAFALFFNEIKGMLSFEEDSLVTEDVNEKWNKVKADISKSTDKKIYKLHDYSDVHRKDAMKKPLYQRILRYAAVLLFVTGLPYLLYNTYNSKNTILAEKEYRIIKVPNSERMSLTLSDGTNVRLDAGSELKVPSNFNEERNVYLKGEAYFKVVHDAKRPFKVFANGALVRVLGTEFNVRAWDESPSVVVTLKRGEVAFSSTKYDSSPTVILTKGKQSILTDNGIPSEPVAVNVDEYTSWTNNELHFKDASLREVLAQLERWYNYHFIVDDTLLYNNRLTYHIKKTNVKNLLQSISIITNTKVVRHGNEIQLIDDNKN